MEFVRPKKHLGQHFLTDKNIARKITQSLLLKPIETYDCIEIGPGTGVLTQFLLENTQLNLHLIDVDIESIHALKKEYSLPEGKIIHGDFLNYDLTPFSSPLLIIGNFPYNISSQIFFRVLENKDKVQQVVCMIQKEVAQRIAEGPGSKTYGILSVFLQAFYTIEYLFTVNETVFFPPPKVKSAVIRLTRNATVTLDCNEAFFFKTVKTAFNQRRKTLRNSIKSLVPESMREMEILNKRPEQLSVNEFVYLVQQISGDVSN